MSAMEVTEEHVTAILAIALSPLFENYRVHWIGTTGYQRRSDSQWCELDHTVADEVGKMLRRENHLSLCARYPQDNDPDDLEVWSTYRYPMQPQPVPTILQAIKLVHFYTYQCNEHKGWETSEAKEFCDRFEAELIRKLPGYDAEPWGIEDLTDLYTPAHPGTEAFLAERERRRNPLSRINPNCDKQECTRPDGEVRRLPLGTDPHSGALILCPACFASEMRFRAERNQTLDPAARFDIPQWNDLEVYPITEAGPLNPSGIASGDTIQIGLAAADHDYEWTASGSEEDPTSRLLATIEVRRDGDTVAFMHWEAYAVKVDDDDLQVAADPEFAAEVDAAQTICDASLQTIHMLGRDYILVATSYGA